MYGSGGFKFIWDTKFDAGMAAFLDCLQQFKVKLEHHFFKHIQEKNYLWPKLNNLYIYYGTNWLVTHMNGPGNVLKFKNFAREKS